MKIIGITGPVGAGKGVIVDYLKKRGFEHFSVRAFITEEIVRRGMPINRDSMIFIGNDLREKHSPSYCVDELFKRAKKSGKNAIIESIRTVGEAESLREKGNFILLGVDADPKKRYGRIVSRNSETDRISFEKFCEQEQLEYTSTNKNKQNIKAVMALVDFTIKNDSTLEELYLKIDKIIKA